MCKIFRKEMKETWKDIPNYEGLYMVSNLGRIKSLPRKTFGIIRVKSERIISPQKDKLGYYSVKPKSVIRLLRPNTLSFCHLPRRFSITMELHCALKAARQLFNNKGCYHHNANDRFGLSCVKMVLLLVIAFIGLWL